MATSTRFTSADILVLPEDNKRYEIIDGELYVSRAPDFHHQWVCDTVCHHLLTWSERTRSGRAFSGAGLIFTEDNDVIPDVLWASFQRLREIVRPDGHFHGAPELVIEVLSAGTENQFRDREAKLKLYSRAGVDEYWIVDWRSRTVDVWRRRGNALAAEGTRREGDLLESPALPGFSLPVADLLVGLDFI